MDLCSLESEDLRRKQNELVGLRIDLVAHSVPIMYISFMCSISNFNMTSLDIGKLIWYLYDIFDK
jgi:hypothetical protein